MVKLTFVVQNLTTGSYQCSTWRSSRKSRISRPSGPSLSVTVVGTGVDCEAEEPRLNRDRRAGNGGEGSPLELVLWIGWSSLATLCLSLAMNSAESGCGSGERVEAWRTAGAGSSSPGACPCRRFNGGGSAMGGAVVEETVVGTADNWYRERHFWSRR